MRNKYLAQDTGTRIDNGIGFYKGSPGLFRVEGTRIRMYNLAGDREIATFDLYSEDMDLTSPKLGYANTKNFCVYLFRIPMRKYKQTLSLDVLGGTIPLSGAAGYDNIRLALFSENGERMFNRDYPEVSVAIDRLRVSQKAQKRLVSMAIDLNVGLAIDSFSIIHVFYKDEEVGLIKPGETIVRIPKSENAWIVSKFLRDYAWEID